MNGDIRAAASFLKTKIRFLPRNYNISIKKKNAYEKLFTISFTFRLSLRNRMGKTSSGLMSLAVQVSVGEI